MLLRPFILSLLSTSMMKKVPRHRFLVAAFIHGGTAPESDDKLVSSICHFLRRGSNWATMSAHFRSLPLSASLVDQVLLQLKEPSHAQRALSFFHWSSHSMNFVHTLHSYSLMLHILVGARLLLDAQAFALSMLQKFQGNSPDFVVVDSVLRTYSLTSSTPFVFDLLVQTYAKIRMFEIGFRVCCYLEEHGFSLSLISFNSLIHVVQKSDDTALAWNIYEHMLRRRIYPNEATVRTMINALCKEGKLKTFVDLLERIHGKRCSPLVIVNTCSVYRILEKGRIQDGMALLKALLRKNMLLDTVAYSLVVYAKLQLGHLDSANEVHEEMLKRGFHRNSFVYTSFIGAYCKVGRIEQANQLMQEMEYSGLEPYDETFNFLVDGCAKAGRAEESWRYCEKMVEKGLVPCLSSFNEMVSKLVEIGSVKEANVLLTCLLDKGFLPNEVTYSLLMVGYEKESQLHEVLKLYHEMQYRSLSPGLMAFTSLIRALCHCGKVEEAEKYLRITKDRLLIPKKDAYEALIKSHFENGDEKRALQLHNEMVCRGLKAVLECGTLVT